MASKRDPSIYNDRSTIGSSDELDEYGVWVKSEPQDLSSITTESQDPLDSSIPDFEDLPDFDSNLGIAGDETESEESFDFEDLPAEDGEPAGESSGSLSENDFTEVSLDDFLGDVIEDLEEPAQEQESQSSYTDVDAIDSFESLDDTEDKVEIDMSDFDDVAAVSRDLQEPAPQTAKSPGADLSTQLLMKIADELSSIKKELSSLKSELSAVRGEAASAESGEESGGGFFDEEDDEKIALTGDELDNILNTADFTEEAGSDATEEIPGDFSSMEEENIGEENILPAGTEEPEQPESFLADDLFQETDAQDSGLELTLDEPDLDEIGGETGLDQPANTGSSILDSQEFDVSLDEAGLEDSFNLSAPEEEISIDLDDEFPETIDVEAKDTEELKQLRQEGAEPMTAPPEDTSYLEEDPLAEEQIDLSGAAIDEPDLSGEIKENPIEEPSLDDISFEIEDSFEEKEGEGDIIFEEEEEQESVPEEELILDIPSGEESFTQVIPDGFVVEAEDGSGLLPEEDGFDLFEESAPEPEPSVPAAAEPPPQRTSAEDPSNIPVNIKQELKTVLSYMDQLLESLPEDKIEEFAKSEHFDTYKKLFEELGLV
jgi:hypothetical protein